MLLAEKSATPENGNANSEDTTLSNLAFSQFNNKKFAQLLDIYLWGACWLQA
jgi:hypothetical protein